MFGQYDNSNAQGFSKTRTFVTAIGLTAALIQSLAAAEYNSPKKLNSPLIENYPSITGFDVTSDFKQVIYSTNENSGVLSRLYVVPSSGSSAGENIASGRYLRSFVMSPDGQRVAYSTSDNYIKSTNALSSRATNLSGSAVALSPTLGGSKDIGTLVMTPDSSHLLFRSEETTNNLGDLYSVPINGPAGSRIKLNADLQPPDGSSIVGVNIIAVSPDSTRVLYLAQNDGDAVKELYSVRVDGSSAPIQLTNNVTVDNAVNGSLIQISQDSSTVLFISNQGESDVNQLYTVPIDGPSEAAYVISHALEGGNVESVKLSPEGTTAVYTARDTSFVNELYSVSVTGESAPVKLNPALVAGGGVSASRYEFTPDSSQVLFIGDVDTDNKDELFSVPSEGPNTLAVKINADLSAGEDITKFSISPNSASVVYQITEYSGGTTRNMYTNNVDGSGTQLKLNPTLVDGGYVEEGVLFSEDSLLVMYAASQDTEDLTELYVVPLDASEPSIKVSGEFALGAEGVGMSNFSVDRSIKATPDFSRVVYIADHDTPGTEGLYSVSVKADDGCYVIPAANGKLASVCL